MAQAISNVAKGKIRTLGELPLTNDAIIWILLQSAGLEALSVLQDYTTLAALLAGASDEVASTFSGGARQTATGVTVTVSQVTDDVLIDCADPQWTVTASAQAIGAVIACYDDDTTGGSDTNLIPFMIDVLSTPFTPTLSVAFPYVVATGGFARGA